MKKSPENLNLPLGVAAAVALSGIARPRADMPSASARKEGRILYRPQAGHAINPLRQFPRNSKCYCGSGTKFKKCHWGKQPESIPQEWADRITGEWDRIVAGEIVIDEKEKKFWNPLTWKGSRPPAPK